MFYILYSCLISHSTCCGLRGVSQGSRVKASTPNVTIFGGDKAYDEVFQVKDNPKGRAPIQ